MGQVSTTAGTVSAGVTTETTPSGVPLVTELRAADFINAMGVNIHINAANGGSATVIADMSYLGLTNVRVHGITPLSSAANLADYAAMANAGLKFDWLMGGPNTTTTADLNTTIAELDAFLTAHPGSIATIEGPNEINNFPITFNGLTGADAAVSYQQALYADLKSNPLTASIPVLNFTSEYMTPGAADATNAHPYPKHGAQPWERFIRAYEKEQASMANLPKYITEIGYSNFTVDTQTQAKETLNLFVDAAKTGMSETYIYELINGNNKSTYGGSFGLFTEAGAPKPVATAIHNLTAILADTGTNATSFTETPLNYTIKGLPTDRTLVIEKSNGVYDLVIWDEPKIWDNTTKTEIAAPVKTVSISLASPGAQVAVFDPLESSNAISVNGGAKVGHSAA